MGIMITKMRMTMMIVNIAITIVVALVMHIAQFVKFSKKPAQLTNVLIVINLTINVNVNN